MSKKYMVKLCMQAEKVTVSELEPFLDIVSHINRMYYNFYRQEYRPTVRYEDCTCMQKCDKMTAKRLLKKRMQGTFPFFFDVYGTDEHGETFMLIREEEKLLLFLLLHEETFFLHKNEIFTRIEHLMEINIFFTGYCCNAGEKTDNLELMLETRRVQYLRYNTVDYETKRIESDEIWAKACWIRWFSENFLGRGKIQELLMCKKFYKVSQVANVGIKVQLYADIDDYVAHKNERLEFYRYMQQNKFFLPNRKE